MQELLRENNIALRHEIEKLRGVLTDAGRNVDAELRTYTEWILNKCTLLHESVLRNIKYLELGQENLLPDILSQTEWVTRTFYDLNGLRATPILRARASDRLALKFLLWLHKTHTQTENIPAAICDGEFVVWPLQPTLYSTPCTAQQGLRNLPIFFHEFGHLLYTFRQSEINAIINELQAEIGDLLRSSVTRNDAYTAAQERKRNVIVNTWYEWAQECLCDAIGFVMGGPAFVYAFSMYFRGFGPSEYYVPSAELPYRTHPVTWIRIQLLADRSRQTGYNTVATDLEEKWQQVAEALGIKEDYDGFYDSAFLPVIQRKLYDMLTETAPRRFHESEVSPQELQETFNSPVTLLNGAWQKFLDDPDSYPEWEKNAIACFLLM